MQDNYGTPPIALVSGSGCWVRDDDGREYLDLLAGIAVNSLGHAHPAVIGAVTEQVATLGHTSNLVDHRARARAVRAPGAARRPAAGRGCSSATPAPRPTRPRSSWRGCTGRPRMVATVKRLPRPHDGRAGADRPAGQGRSVPTAARARSRSSPTATSRRWRAAVDDDVAAVILEPIQGEAGVVVPPAGYLAAARGSPHDAGALLILDEVQTGIGRTGHWFAHHADTEQGIRPGHRHAGQGARRRAADRRDDPAGPRAACRRSTPGSHGSTFGGNPISAAAALAVLDTIAGDGTCSRTVRERGEQLRSGLSARRPAWSTVRGAGLLLGVVLAHRSRRRSRPRRAPAGVLVNAAAPDVIRLAPPLILTRPRHGTASTC